MMRPRTNASHNRGFTLTEAMMAMGLMSVIFSISIGLYVRGSQAFSQEQSMTYVQSRVRATLDSIAKEIRQSREIAKVATVNGQTYSSALSGNDACLILRVPAQDATGTWFRGDGAYTGTFALDTIVYSRVGNTLRRSVQPSVNVLDSNGNIRTSFRPAETNTLIADNIADFNYALFDNNAIPLAEPTARTASVDLRATIRQVHAGTTQNRIAVTGIRMRNKQSGGIAGQVTSGQTIVRIEAEYASAGGAYTSGTIVNSAPVVGGNLFEITNLVEGDYFLHLVNSSGAAVRLDDKKYKVLHEQVTTGVAISYDVSEGEW
jgi:prepilin-type N-terminal cleavage/methylation domain-containing protein